MAEERGAEAVLITGVYGSGKTSVVEEIADILEGLGAPYAALDLDWLAWFDTGSLGEAAANRMLLKNLASLVSNYLAAGVRHFVLAGAYGERSELDDLRAELPMPLRVVRLSVPLPEIERRLRSDPTTGRQHDLRVATAWVAASRGVGIEDIAVTNDRPVRQVAQGILDWLGWN